MLMATKTWSPAWVAEVTGGTWLQVPEGTFKGQVTTDSRSCARGDLFLAIRGDRFDGHDFIEQAISIGSWAVVVQPGCDRRWDGIAPSGQGVLAVANPRAALGALAHAWRQHLTSTCVIAITGSCGKTTTKDLLHKTLGKHLRGTAAAASFNNDLGVPLTILNASPDDEYLVVEIGTNAMGEIASLAEMAQPNIGLITMIGTAHLAGFDSPQAIVDEKLSLLEHVQPGGLAVFPYVYKDQVQVTAASLQVVTSGAMPGAAMQLIGRGWDGQANRGWFEVADATGHSMRFDLALPGEHNAHNAIAVLAIARSLGVPDQVIGESFVLAEPSSMRFEIQNIDLGDEGSVTFCNDAYNANPDSVRASLASFLEQSPLDARLVVVLGDMLELGSTSEQLHRELAFGLLEMDVSQRIAEVVCVGPNASLVAEELQASGRSATARSNWRQSDLAHACKSIRADDWVLLKGSRGIGLERVIEIVSGSR